METDPTAFCSCEEDSGAADTLYQVVELRGQSIAGRGFRFKGGGFGGSDFDPSQFDGTPQDNADGDISAALDGSDGIGQSETDPDADSENFAGGEARYPARQ